MALTYLDWLTQQPPERALFSLYHCMVICRELGELQRSEPNSQRTKDLSRKVADYYALQS